MKKKLLITIDTIKPMVDGVSTFLDRIIPHLKQVYDITVIAPDYGNPDYPDVRILKYPVVKLQSNGYGPPKTSLKWIKMIKKEVKKCDLVFNNESVSPYLNAYIFAMRYCRKYKKPFFTYVHSIDWELFPEVTYIPEFIRKTGKYILSKYARWCLNNKNNIVIVSFPTIAEILKNINVKGQIEFAPIGISEIFKPGDSKYAFKDKIVLGYAGRVSREKGLIVLLNIYKKLLKKYDNIHLLIVGEGPEKVIFEGIKNVTTTGFVSPEEVAEYYRSMDIFVLPSFTEANSLSTLEALKSGVCCVTRNVGAIKDYLKNDYNGYVFDTNEELEEILEKLIEDEKLLKKLKNNASKSVQEYTWENTSNHLINIFNKYM